jgi:hypothetical protein
MKKIFCIAAILLMLAGSAWGIEWNRHSEQTATAAITTASGYFGGVILATDGTNNVTISVYDNASAASGTKLLPTTVVTTSAANRSTAIDVNPAVRFYNGIYVEITCAGTVTYHVHYVND